MCSVLKKGQVGDLSYGYNNVSEAPSMNAILILSVAAYLAAGGTDGIDSVVVCLIVMGLSGPYHARRVEQMRRGKAILNRYSPERNPRPLGL